MSAQWYVRLTGQRNQDGDDKPGERELRVGPTEGAPELTSLQAFGWNTGNPTGYEYLLDRHGVEQMRDALNERLAQLP